MWHKPADKLPECYTGDRIVGIVRYRENPRHPIRPHVIVLVATEDGWDDDAQTGYGPEDCELWAYERDVIAVAIYDVLRTIEEFGL
jgi:hypothetical protein